MSKQPYRLLGFTLLELLVVISIIGILVAMGAASFSFAQKQARDARRRADMKSYQNCMEQAYVEDDNKYNGASSGACAVSDPVPNPTNPYHFVTAAATYTACAHLDNGKGNADSKTYGGVSGDWFCVRNLQ